MKGANEKLNETSAHANLVLQLLRLLAELVQFTGHGASQSVILLGTPKSFTWKIGPQHKSTCLLHSSSMSTAATSCNS